jgi:hypothetical protein
VSVCDDDFNFLGRHTNTAKNSAEIMFRPNKESGLEINIMN